MLLERGPERGDGLAVGVGRLRTFRASAAKSPNYCMRIAWRIYGECGGIRGPARCTRGREGTHLAQPGVLRVERRRGVAPGLFMIHLVKGRNASWQLGLRYVTKRDPTRRDYS
jgi:hypothetical protein